MNAVEIIRQQARMCNEMESCKVCPIGQEVTGHLCRYYRLDHPEKAVELVEKWAKEHPEKTILQDFLEKYPNCEKDRKGCPKSCPKHLGYVKDCPVAKGRLESCRECWNQSLDDNNAR